ncbi:MAG: trimethylamine corrinoid protein 2 [Spirochaetales bacterium]|jgi:hypothetical protein|nr:trimethylamine corrinoid protein 2 [Spirochaetales bacterium]
MNNKNIYKAVPQWDETKERFISWWAGGSLGSPLIRIVAKNPAGADSPEPPSPSDPQDFHLNGDYHLAKTRNGLSSDRYLADAFPHTTVNMGAGSLALYIGSEPVFDFNTVWFNEFVENWKTTPRFEYNEKNPWWILHQEIIRKMVKSARGEFYIDIPDIIENLDILASVRGAQNLCIDLMDCPEEISRRIDEINSIYFNYYNRMYDIVKDTDGSSSYTAFSVWGPGKTVKLQSDFSAMMSPDQFKDMVVPSLRHQCINTDSSVYHLDGPDAIRHVDSLMSISELNALQWTAGAGHPDGGWEGWFDIYRKVRKAGKALHISIYDGSTDEIYDRADNIIRAVGRDGIYFLFPSMELNTADAFLEKARKNW